MEYMSLRSNGTVYKKLYLVWSVGWNSDCYERGKTFRVAVATEIQTSCNLKTNLCERHYLLERVYCHFSNTILKSLSGIMVWYQSYISLSRNLDLFLHKNFLHPQSSSRSSTRRCSTTELNKSTEHSAIQKGSVHCNMAATDAGRLLSTWLCSGA